MKKRLMAFVLAVCMVVCLLPVSAFAECEWYDKSSEEIIRRDLTSRYWWNYGIQDVSAYQFNEDGTWYSLHCGYADCDESYADEGIQAAVITQPVAADETGSSGTYTISGNTVTLTWTDGYQVSMKYLMPDEVDHALTTDDAQFEWNYRKFPQTYLSNSQYNYRKILYETGFTKDEESGEGNALWMLPYADTTGKCGDNLTWTFDESTGTLTISGTGDMWDYAWSLGDSWATDVVPPWEEYGFSVKNIVIESGVTSIGDEAFMPCGESTITIPDGVTRIGYSAFAYNDQMESITIPTSVTTIEEVAFEVCGKLMDIYYQGTEEQWNQITLADDWLGLVAGTPDDLEIHYNSTGCNGNHTWDDGVVTTEATTEAEGVKTYTCTVCGETKEETIGKLVITPTLPTEDDEEYYSGFVNSWLLTGGKDINYLCTNSNFPNSVFVRNMDGSAGDTVLDTLANAIFRGIKGWKELADEETSKDEAKEIILDLLYQYKSNVEWLADFETASEFSDGAVDAFDIFIEMDAGKDLNLNSSEVSALREVMTDDKTVELLQEMEYSSFADMIADVGNYDKSSSYYKALQKFESSSAFAERLGKITEELGYYMDAAEITVDTFKNVYQLKALATADEMYLEMLKYIRDNCAYSPASEAAGELYGAANGKMKAQLEFLADDVAGYTVDAAISEILDYATDGSYLLGILKIEYKIGEMIVDSTWEARDSMRITAKIGETLAQWLKTSKDAYQSETDVDAKEQYAKQTTYATYMLIQTRREGEEALRDMIKLSQTGYPNHNLILWSKTTSSNLNKMEKELEERHVFDALTSTVSCPVDVEVYDANNTLVVTAKDGAESSGNSGDVYYDVYYDEIDDDYVKIIHFPENSGYTLKCVGNALGRATISLSDVDSEGNLNIITSDALPVDKQSTLILSNVSMENSTVTLEQPSGTATYEMKNTYETYVPVTEVAFAQTSGTMTVGEELRVEYTISPTDATVKYLTWTSDNEAVATVNSDGVITAIVEGEATIRAVSPDLPDGAAEFKITVKKQDSATPAPLDTTTSCTRGNTCPIAAFPDTEVNGWYHDGVHYCLENEIMNGITGYKFAPNAETTRAMIVTMLWRQAGKPDAAAASYSDVPSDAWYTEAVNWATEQGIALGYGDGRFGPNDVITREQIATMLTRYAKLLGKDTSATCDLSKWTDAGQISGWATDSMQYICGVGIIQGRTATTLAPKATATRAEVATMVYRFLTKL